VVLDHSNISKGKKKGRVLVKKSTGMPDQWNKGTVVQNLFSNCIGIYVYTCMYVNKQFDMVF
jgi:hypothetical protein